MKNRLTKTNNLDDDMMSAAVKKAAAGFKATMSQTRDTGAITTAKQAASRKQDTENPLKLDSIERRLNYADQAIIPPVKRPPIPSNTVRQTPRLSEVQQYEDYYQQEQQRIQSIEKAESLDAFERILRHDLYGEPLAKKPTPLESGVIALKDSGSASLGAGSPLAKNGARTRGYTDTASDSGAPIRFTGGTLKDIERKHNEAMARRDETMNLFYGSLAVHHIDRSNLTAEQKEVVDLVEQELNKKSIQGTLTEKERESVIDKTWKYLYTHTKAANGDPYPVFIDIAKTGIVAPYDAIIDLPEKNDYVKGPFPEQIAMNTDVLSNKDLKMIFEYGRQKSNNDIEAEKYKQEFAYKNKVYVEEMNNYFDDLRKGKATPKDRKKYLDQALLRIYEDCFKPVPVKDKRGNDAGTIPIGELIPPYDDSFGEQIVREAIRLLGLEYLHKANEIILGENGDYSIDCSRLVCWTLSEINPEWKYDTISTSARYQINGFDSVWSNSVSAKPPYEDMHPGDTLFWKGNETGEIVHTAIYIGMVDEVPMMIEAGETVQIVEVRERTKNNNGEDSTLVQVNRMTPEELDEHHDQNTAKNIN